jgi:thiol-disulfide isomerase/thioredoxin
LTRENLWETINDPTKHVIVAYVTPWCHYCKEVYKMYKKVHKHLHAHVRDFVFASIDYMENDLDIAISSFPTILIYPKGDKKNPILYDMIRDYNVFLNFLEDKKLGTSIYKRPPPPGLEESQRNLKR